MFKDEWKSGSTTTDIDNLNDWKFANIIIELEYTNISQFNLTNKQNRVIGGR